jgi:hypothetical protein
MNLHLKPLGLACLILTPLGCSGSSAPAPTPPLTFQLSTGLRTSLMPPIPTMPTQASAPKFDHMKAVVKGRTVQEWFDRARDKAQIKTNREDAIQVLAQGGESGAYALFELLSAKDADTVDPKAPFGMHVSPGYVRWQAAQAFSNLGKRGLPAAPRLTELIKSDDVVEVRIASAIALGRMGARDVATLKALKDVLRSEDYLVWQGAVYALAQVRPHDAETVELLKKISDADPYKVAPRGNDRLWTGVMNARMEARSALLPR